MVDLSQWHKQHTCIHIRACSLSLSLSLSLPLPCPCKSPLSCECWWGLALQAAPMQLCDCTALTLLHWVLWTAALGSGLLLPVLMLPVVPPVCPYENVWLPHSHTPFHSPSPLLSSPPRLLPRHGPLAVCLSFSEATDSTPCSEVHPALLLLLI